MGKKAKIIFSHRSIGLGFDLQRAEFELDESEQNATIKVDKKEHTGWHFEIHQLDSDHVSSVAYGPPEEADESCGYINRVKVNLPQELPRVGFTLLTFQELTQGMESLC